MQDMLVKLYALPDLAPLETAVSQAGISVRRPLSAEKPLLTAWVEDWFGLGWASETEVCFSFQPVSCFMAVHENKIVGFACHDSAFRNFFGPTGVDEAYRGMGIGKLLLLKCLYAMRDQGYVYGIIGGVGPAGFYEKAVNAVLIGSSSPGIHSGLLKEAPMD